MNVYHDRASIADRLGPHNRISCDRRHGPQASKRPSALQSGMLMPRLIGATFAMLFLLAGTVTSSAQQTPGQTTSVGSPPARAAKPLADEPVHRFWDRENDLLFAGVAGARALDYSSTLNLRRRGRQEILLTDWVVDDHGLFAGIEASGVALFVGVSYIFHRTGHHKLERWVSIVHIGVATGGAVRNYGLKTFHTN